MRKLILIAGLFLCTQSWAVHETFAADNTDPGLCDVTLNADGTGHFYLSGDFGGGTASLEQYMNNGQWEPIETYLAVTDPKTNSIRFAPKTRLRVTLSGSTSPTLDCEIDT